MDDVPNLLGEFVLLRSCREFVHYTRHARERAHPLVSVLWLTVLALMAGGRSLDDINRWGKLHSEVLGPLKLRRSPSVATLGRLLRLVSVIQLINARPLAILQPST